jgi:hypothetical protein
MSNVPCGQVPVLGEVEGERTRFELTMKMPGAEAPGKIPIRAVRRVHSSETLGGID